MNPSSESAKPCCKPNTINCSLHCATHPLNRNIQQYMRFLVISYFYPTDEILLPPALPPTESRSDLFMYKEKYFRIIENKGDGLCLLYSVTHFLKEHMNSTGYTLQKGCESLTKITNFETLTGSGIIELVARFVGDLTDEEFHTMTE